MTGRTIKRWNRVYVGGYDLSGYTRQFGPLLVDYGGESDNALADAVKGALPDQAILGFGELNVFLDYTPDGSHDVLAGSEGQDFGVMAAVGFRAEPVAGDPAFCGIFPLLRYQAPISGSFVTVSAGFGMTPVTSLIPYSNPWGVLLHAKAARTAVNTSIGIDDNGAATSKGGYMAWQVLAGDGTATLKVQDASTNTNPSFADLAAATTGVINCAVPGAGIVALSVAATVRRYLRWQIVFGTATTVTFALAFSRVI